MLGIKWMLPRKQDVKTITPWNESAAAGLGVIWWAVGVILFVAVIGTVMSQLANVSTTGWAPTAAALWIVVPIIVLVAGLAFIMGKKGL